MFEYNPRLERQKCEITEANYQALLECSRDQLLSLTGAQAIFPLDELKIVKMGGVYPAVTIWLEHETKAFEIRRTVEFKERIVYNDLLVAKNPPGGLAIKCLDAQVDYLRSHDFEFIRCWAWRGFDKGIEYFGHSLWPELGFYVRDKSLNKVKTVAKKFDVEFVDFDTLYSLPNGKELWRHHGKSFFAEFDLSEGSTSMARLAQEKEKSRHFK